MVLRIARKELTEILRDGRFRWLAGLVLALSVTSLAAGWKHFSEVDRQHQEAQQATRADWLAQPAKNPHSAAHYGMYAFKPKQPEEPFSQQLTGRRTSAQNRRAVLGPVESLC
jgi:ABC-2 type transport system permease protein